MKKEHVHLIGIGGTGMTALAGLLHEAGCRVTGSDGHLYPPTSTILASLGLEVHEGYQSERLKPAPDLVVIGNAVKRGNPEAEEVLDRRLKYASMPQVIEERFLPGRHSVVVAGTHGKTTTSSMLAWVLTQAGRDPGYLIGGLPANLDQPFHLGGGEEFILEGDEYDTAFFDKGPKFMHYRPDTALLGTVEFDHADIYRDLDHVCWVFERFVNLIPRRGLLIRHDDSELTRQVSRNAFSRVRGYGLRHGEWRAENLIEDAESTRFRLVRDGRELAEVRMGMPGEHNVLNALAVSAAAFERGVSAEAIAAGLGSFQGVARRQQVRGVEAGVTVIDDFAHHPTAIAASVKSIRHRFPQARVWAVLEPRSWSLRRKVFQQRLESSFGGADEVLIADVFRAADIPAEERLDPEMLVHRLDRGDRPAHFLPRTEQILEHLLRQATSGDVVLVMSNGGFDRVHERLLEGLRRREDE